MTREEFSKEQPAKSRLVLATNPKCWCRYCTASWIALASSATMPFACWQKISMFTCGCARRRQFYHDFRTSPAAKHVVKICEAEACQAMGSRELTAHAKSSLGLDMHSSNDKVTLEPVYCLGNCALVHRPSWWTARQLVGSMPSVSTRSSPQLDGGAS